MTFEVTVFHLNLWRNVDSVQKYKKVLPSTGRFFLLDKSKLLKLKSNIIDLSKFNLSRHTFFAVLNEIMNMEVFVSTSRQPYRVCRF